MKLFRAAALSLACLSLPSLASDLPLLGDASSAIVSPEQEYRLGRAWLGLLRGQIAPLDDPQLKDYVERSVYRLAETSELHDKRLEFVILNSPQINAFAAPGGIIGVNGGLLLHAQTEGEYASVMAHELAHLSQRHFARGLEAQQRMQIPVMAAMLAGIVAAAAGAGDAGMATIIGAQAAAIQGQRSFSRQNEQEADRIGLQNLQRAGYDPRSMPSMFERLMRQYRYSSKPPEFLLTHPVTENRVADTRNRAEQFPASGRDNSLEYQLMRARLQLHFEETPGISTKRFRDLLNSNPEIDAARYGLALSLTRSGQLEGARSELQTLLEKSPNELHYHLAMIELDSQANKLDQAQQRIEQLRTRHPNSYPVAQARIDLLIKQGQHQLAEQALDELLKRRNSDPDVWYQISEVRGLTGNIIGLHQSRAEFFALVGDYDQAIEQLDLAKRRASNNFPLASRIDARQQALRSEQRELEKMMGR